MLPFYGGLLGTSEEVVTFFRTNQGVDRMSIKSQRIGGVQRGDSISCLLTKDNRLYGGSECGNIYEFTINKDECLWSDLVCLLLLLHRCIPHNRHRKGMGRKFAVIEITQQRYKVYLEDIVRVFRRKIDKNPKVPGYDRDALSSATRNDS